MLTLDSLSDMNLTVCAVFTISLMLSMLCVFFTIIQQLEFSVHLFLTFARYLPLAVDGMVMVIAKRR